MRSIHIHQIHIYLNTQFGFSLYFLGLFFMFWAAVILLVIKIKVDMGEIKIPE